MVEGPQGLAGSHPPRRRRPSRGRLRARRFLAATLLAAGLGLLGWLVVHFVSNDDTKAATTTSTRPAVLRIVFPEGFTRRQMAERITAVDAIAEDKRGVKPLLSAPEYLAATLRSKLPGQFAGDGKLGPLEGFLFPATYDFTPQTTSAQLVRDQLAAFRREWKKVGLGYARSKNLTQYDVLIIASMIEKEVRAPEERRLVAAVIYNRLHNGMRLQIDATIRYGLNVPPTQALTKAQLRSRNPYNTRVHYSLPPTPIANPGFASMYAAAHPAKVDYLYFVRKPDKVHHFFTASLAAFNRYARAHGFSP